MVFKQLSLGKTLEIRGFGSRIQCRVSFSRISTDQVLEDFSLDKGNWELTLKKMKS